MRLIKAARTSVNVQSPYFITTKDAEQLIKEITDRHVQIKLITNSLASTDMVSSFGGYKKIRRKILDLGIDIYEFRPDAHERLSLMLPDLQERNHYGAVYGFHSKTLVIDSTTTIVGSFNFDPRSANFNTECIAVIRSEKIAGKVLERQEEELQPENTWHVEKGRTPDHYAPVLKRIKLLLQFIIPKQVL
jgi:phosphatidylserine/phosphatidylglycerophosphate/cardiolipin synthase-like enzyme